MAEQTNGTPDDGATKREPNDKGKTAKAGHKSKRQSRPAKPSDLWLKALTDPYKARLKRKAWLEVGAGLLAIGQAGCLALAIGALITDNLGLQGTLPYAATLMGVIILRALFSYGAGRIGHAVASDIKYGLRLRLSEELADQSPLDMKRRSAGEIAALGSDVIETLDAYISRYLSLRLQLTVIPFAIALSVGWFSWAAALVLLLCGPLIPVFMAIVGIRAKKASDDQISALSDMSSRFLDRLSGMTTLRLFHAVTRTRNEFEDIANQYRRATMRVLRIAFLSSAALELFSAIGIALIAIYVGYHYLGFADWGNYGVPITLSSGLFMLLLAPDFFTPLRDFAAAYHDRATAQSAGDRLLQVLPIESLKQQASDSLEMQTEQPEAMPTRTVIEQIGFEEADLGYSDGHGAVLRDVSLTIRQGEKVAILGASGAGKSTLLSALCGLLPPSAGQLTINGVPAPEPGSDWEPLRQNIAWIGQRPHVFHGSLLMNARLTAPDADRGQVKAALEQAHADRFVAQLPRDLLTVLGETGFGISGGQVRRLAIARAALANASLILCDEPTADLDADTARLVSDSLIQMSEGHILLVATHDRSVAELCDRILYVKNGTIEEIDRAALAAIDEASLLNCSGPVETGSPDIASTTGEAQ